MLNQHNLSFFGDIDWVFIGVSFLLELSEAKILTFRGRLRLIGEVSYPLRLSRSKYPSYFLGLCAMSNCVVSPESLSSLSSSSEVLLKSISASDFSICAVL